MLALRPALTASLIRTHFIGLRSRISHFSSHTVVNRFTRVTSHLHDRINYRLLHDSVDGKIVELENSGMR